jgi:hypothetical protein
MNNLEIGPLFVTLHKTIKVKDNNEPSNLPPSLGTFDIYRVSEYKANLPKNWDENAYFIIMHDKEAMWMSFQAMEPLAVIIGAGTINSLDGKPFNNKLEKDNYLVTPPQPWLDGWKGEDGNVYQFVSTKVGEGHSIGEQLSNSNDHAISISVFKAKHPEKLQSAVRPITTWGESAMGDCDYFTPICSSYGAQLCSFSGHQCNTEMGIGKGGMIKQKIYEDPHGLEVWKEEPEKTLKIYLINASEFCEIVGKPVPETPVKAEQYNGAWYGLKDEHLSNTTDVQVFKDLKAVPDECVD